MRSTATSDPPAPPPSAPPSPQLQLIGNCVINVELVGSTCEEILSMPGTVRMVMLWAGLQIQVAVTYVWSLSHRVWNALCHALWDNISCQAASVPPEPTDEELEPSATKRLNVRFQATEQHSATPSQTFPSQR